MLGLRVAKSVYRPVMARFLKKLVAKKIHFYRQGPLGIWECGEVVRALDSWAEYRWIQLNPWIIVGMFAHCSPSRRWLPGGNTEEKKRM